MKLSPKATRFVIEALEYYQRDHLQRLQTEGLSEDDLSDLENDRQFLKAILQDFRDFRDELAERREGVEIEA